MLLRPSCEYNGDVNKEFLEESLRDFYPDIYSLSFALVPEILQSEQICLDAAELLLLKEAWILEELLEVESQHEESRLLRELKKHYFKHVWELGVKRFDQLKGSLEVAEDYPKELFFNLGALERGILFLKVRSKFNLDDIEFISGCDRYEILSYLTKSRNDLLKIDQGRSIAVPAVIGS